MNQINLFDIESDEEIEQAAPIESIIFEVNEMVKVKKLPKRAVKKLPPEDYFYLKDFEGKIGRILERAMNKANVYTYEVEFDRNRTGYFYGEDLLLI